jgi:hypothetical protein
VVSQGCALLSTGPWPLGNPSISSHKYGCRVRPQVHPGGFYHGGRQGWALAVELLAWLRDHGSPAGVSGAMHRLQLLLGLRYLALGTRHLPADRQRR